MYVLVGCCFFFCIGMFVGDVMLCWFVGIVVVVVCFGSMGIIGMGI